MLLGPQYSWRKGEHSKTNLFNPDFFLKVGSHILVIEIKEDGEIFDPSDENKAKFKAARQHFETLNGMQDDRMCHVHFLTPHDYDTFFSFLREAKHRFVSALDAALAENGV